MSKDISVEEFNSYRVSMITNIERLQSEIERLGKENEKWGKDWRYMRDLCLALEQKIKVLEGEIEATQEKEGE